MVLLIKNNPFDGPREEWKEERKQESLCKVGILAVSTSSGSLLKWPTVSVFGDQWPRLPFLSYTLRLGHMVLLSLTIIQSKYQDCRFSDTSVILTLLTSHSTVVKFIRVTIVVISGKKKTIYYKQAFYLSRNLLEVVFFSKINTIKQN